MIKYDETRKETLSAIAVAFDLEGFSDFCKHPDNLPKVPKLISHLFSLLSRHSGDIFDLISCPDDAQMFLEPDFMKYTGDGALLLWRLRGDPEADNDAVTTVVGGMRRFQNTYAQQAREWERQLMVSHLPKNVRVGIAGGEVYPLYLESPVVMPNSQPADYVGYCINLAFRLQAHFPELGFMVQERLKPSIKGLRPEKAINVRGCHSEEVLIFEDDFERVSRTEETNCSAKLWVPDF